MNPPGLAKLQNSNLKSYNPVLMITLRVTAFLAAAAFILTAVACGEDSEEPSPSTTATRSAGATGNANAFGDAVIYARAI